MEYYKNHSLLQYNTFQIKARAAHFYLFDKPCELQDWLLNNNAGNSSLVMGGGSNLLFTGDYSGTIIYPAFKGMKIIAEDGADVLVRFEAGENWDECVAWSVKQGLGGIENLSYIPGNAGAAPVQNIGAYGVELADVMEYAEGFYLENGLPFRKTRSECDFKYRYSVFKGPLRNKIVITRVVLRLSRKPEFRLDYGPVKQAVESLGCINLENIRRSIIDIRREKLPEPDITGNAGSFFKNPVVTSSFYEQLKIQWSQIPGYMLQNNELVKVPAGWLIEHAGWKGKTIGSAGVHDKQALVLINKGGATGAEIVQLAEAIQADVFQKFGIQLEPEVNMI